MIDSQYNVKQQEPVQIAAFISEATVERLDKRLIRGISESGEIQDDRS